MEDIVRHPKKIEDFVYSEEEDPHCDVDKAWQIIHFLLTENSYEGSPPEKESHI
ncbi:YfbM family protein [Leptospira borgpetersenii]|nr:YfbM family protein [Leptospira borgpetersenii]UVD75973.1 YfbM family protein [Leptospira borgpetersenii]UZW32532.1 YfbM family protein [Leptospira borgpetersenii]